MSVITFLFFLFFFALFLSNRKRNCRLRKKYKSIVTVFGSVLQLEKGQKRRIAESSFPLPIITLKEKSEKSEEKRHIGCEQLFLLFFFFWHVHSFVVLFYVHFLGFFLHLPAFVIFAYIFLLCFKPCSIFLSLPFLVSSILFVVFYNFFS